MRAIGKLIALLSVVTTFGYDTSEWKCFDDEPMVVKYTDTGNPVPLPRYRTLVGDWSSWILTNWLAKILLKEKMGIELDFWCTDDWMQYGKCDSNYPKSTWDKVEDGTIDMNLEAWVRAGASAGHLQRTYDGKVLDYGPIGTTGMANLYTADYDGTWMLGNWKALKSKAVRDKVFEDMTPVYEHFKHKGWLKAYTETWSEPGAYKSGTCADTVVDSNTVITKPIIIAAGHCWAHTKLIWDKLNKMGVAQYYDLWLTSSEPTLSELVDYAGARGAHFVSQLFSPGYDLASFQKQRIAWPVPKQAGCSANATCEAEMEPLYKVVHPLNIKKIPEVSTFIERLRIPGNVEMSAIMFDQLQNNEPWKVSACNWLKVNEDLWTAYIIPIKRIEKVEPWYVIYVQIGCVSIAAITLGVVTWQIWKCMKPDANVGARTQDEEIRKEAMQELMMLAYLMVMDISDVIVTCWATATCFDVASGRPFLVVCFVIILIMEFIYNIIITYQRFQLAGAALKFLREGKMDVKMFDAHYTVATSHANIPRQSVAKLMYTLNYELLTLIAGLGEDMPSLILYVYMFSEGFLEVSFITGALMSSYSFGWKMSSVEKYTLHKKLQNVMSDKKMVGDSDKST